MRCGFTHHEGRAKAALIGERLLLANVADPLDWVSSRREPAVFIERTISRWVRHAGGDLMKGRKSFPFAISMTTDLDEWAWDAGAPATNLKRVWLVLSMDSGMFELRPVIELLNAVHPRLPATFYTLVHPALHRLVPVWCPNRAEEWLENAADWVDEMREAEGEGDWPAADGSAELTPEVLRAKPLAASTLRAVLAAAPHSARALMDAAAALAVAAADVGDEMMPWKALRARDIELMPPLDHIVLPVDAGDVIQRSFDVEYDGTFNSGEAYAPARIYCFDATRNAGVVAARDEVVRWTRAIVAAQRLFRVWPDRVTDPRALVNTLDLDEVEPIRLPVRV